MSNVTAPTIWKQLRKSADGMEQGPLKVLLLEICDRGERLELLYRNTRRLREARQKGYEMSIILRSVEELSVELDQ